MYGRPAGYVPSKSDNIPSRWSFTEKSDILVGGRERSWFGLQTGSGEIQSNLQEGEPLPQITAHQTPGRPTGTLLVNTTRGGLEARPQTLGAEQRV